MEEGFFQRSICGKCHFEASAEKSLSSTGHENKISLFVRNDSQYLSFEEIDTKSKK